MFNQRVLKMKTNNTIGVTYLRESSLVSWCTDGMCEQFATTSRLRRSTRPMHISHWSTPLVSITDRNLIFALKSKYFSML